MYGFDRLKTGWPVLTAIRGRISCTVIFWRKRCFPKWGPQSGTKVKKWLNTKCNCECWMSRYGGSWQQPAEVRINFAASWSSEQHWGATQPAARPSQRQSGLAASPPSVLGIRKCARVSRSKWQQRKYPFFLDIVQVGLFIMRPELFCSVCYLHSSRGATILATILLGATTAASLEGGPFSSRPHHNGIIFPPQNVNAR